MLSSAGCGETGEISFRAMRVLAAAALGDPGLQLSDTTIPSAPLENAKARVCRQRELATIKPRASQLEGERAVRVRSLPLALPSAPPFG
jgi:hypothetical protein